MDTLLLLIENSRNRCLLTQWLQDSYRLIPLETSSAPPSFDLCVIDPAGLKRGEGVLAQLKTAAGETFLPVLLVTSTRAMNSSAGTAPSIIDEIITTPIHHAELLTRVEALLRTRRLSLKILHSRSSEQRRAQQKLASSEELQKAMIACSPLAIYSIDPAGRVTSWNESAQRIFGWSAAEVVGRLLPIVQADKREEFTGFVRRVLTGESLDGIEVVRQRKDGSLFYGSLSCGPLRSADGEIIGIMAMMEDISTRKRFDAALRESEERFRLLVENAPDGIFIQTQGKIAYLNKAAVRLTGVRTAKQLLGVPVLDLFPPEYRETITERMRQLTESRQPVPALHLPGRRRDGSLVEIEVSAVPFRFAGQDGALAFVRDLSDRSEAERERRHLLDQLHQAQKLESVGRLAGGVAHDFNNLLSVILGYGQLILDEMGPDHPHHEPMTQMVQAGLRARDLTRQLLAFSRKQILQMHPVDLNEVVTGFEKLLRRVIGEDITLELVLATRPLPIKGDSAQLEQVLMNLAVNARDAMPDGGGLIIETAAVELDQAYAESRPGVTPGAYAMMAVRDTGCGMEHATIEHIFEPFFTTKDQDKGTGLGLATSYGIIKQHGGNIWVYSEPGQGTTFKIYLPLSDEYEQASAPSVRSQEPLTGTATVLIVEDDPSLRQMVARILCRQGYSVIDSENVDDAITQAESHADPIHLVLTDVVMPGMQGPEVVEKIRVSHPEAKVLYMSGYTDDIIVRHGALKEGIEFLQKPFSVESLAAKVHEVLNR